MRPRRLRLSGLTRFQRRQEGTAAIEYAFLGPVLIMLSIGVLDVGRLAWSISSINNTAREAARYASVRGDGTLLEADSAEIVGFALGRYIGMDKESLVVDVSWTPDNRSGGTVMVTLTLPFEFLAGRMLGLDPLSLSGQSSMVVH